jgi:hypothetical protein
MRTRVILVAGVVLAAACAGASAETFSARSGKTGNVIDEARIDPGDALRGLIILEKSDRPCVVQVYGNLWGIEEYDDRIDKCKGTGPKKADGINPYKGQVLLTGGGIFATGLKVCLSNSDRVKGWTLYGKSYETVGTVSDSFKRPNCPDDGWQARVDCPAGTKAVGVRAHFEPGTGNNSDMLRGMQLICD